ncbi:transcription antitermination factor NusB [soil metagenome]
MGRRRDGREAAAQFLYSRDFNREPCAEDLDAFWSLRAARPGVIAFANEIIAGVLSRLGTIDAHLEDASDNFQLDRFAAIDRNILRVAVYELLFQPDVPRPVVIDEAIEIAKRFGTLDSPAFVNGVLDRVNRSIQSEP